MIERSTILGIVILAILAIARIAFPGWHGWHILAAACSSILVFVSDTWFAHLIPNITHKEAIPMSITSEIEAAALAALKTAGTAFSAVLTAIDAPSFGNSLAAIMAVGAAVEAATAEVPPGFVPAPAAQ